MLANGWGGGGDDSNQMTAKAWSYLLSSVSRVWAIIFMLFIRTCGGSSENAGKEYLQNKLAGRGEKSPNINIFLSLVLIEC